MAGSIIVIGAGVTGLYAAHLLAEKQFEIVMLEARDRTGGRVNAISQKFSRPMEAGAEFVHGTLPITNKLIKAAGLRVATVEGEFYEIVNGELQDASFLNDEIEEVSRVMKKLEADMPFASFMQKSFGDDKYESLRTQLFRLVQGYDGADPNRISTFAIRDEWASWNEEDDIRLVGGYAGVTEYLERSLKSKNVPIHLSHVVEKILWSAGQVTVITDKGSFSASKVLLTVPVSILQQEQIVFSPNIPLHLEAARKIGFGAVIKFIFEFKENIRNFDSYNTIGDFRFIFCDREIPTWWSQLPESSLIFTGWLAGPKASIFTNDEQEQYSIAINTLAYILRITTRDVESCLRAWHIQDWVHDPFCRGGYCYQMVDTRAAVRLINESIQNTLYFAGEGLATGESMGTVEAAFESAEYTVRKIIS
jgi:monoamine oxidase